MGGKLNAQRGAQPFTPLRITFFAPRIYPVLVSSEHSKSAGGAEVQQASLIDQFAKLGYQVSVVCNGPYAKETIHLRENITVFILGSPGHRGVPGLRFIYPNVTDAAAAIVETDPNVIYQRGAGAATAAAALAAARSRCAFIYGCASDADFSSAQKSKIHSRRDRWLFNRAINRANAIVLQNIEQQKVLPAHLVKRSQIIPNILNPALELPLKLPPHRPATVLWVGSLGEVKRPDRFIEIVRACPDIAFHMICPTTGDQYREVRFAHLMNEATAIANLRITRYVNASMMREQYRDASLLISTSDYEGYPNIFMEAWSASLPVISFVNPTLPAACMPQQVVTSTAQMISAVRLLMQDATKRQLIGEHSLAFVLKHHASKMVLSQYRDLFSSLQIPPSTAIK